MKYVLDANVAAFSVLRNPLTQKSLQLLEDYRRAVHELIAPSHFPAEIANALTKAERQKLIPVGDAAGLVGDLLSTPPLLYSIDPLFYRAVDISSRTRSSFLDCLYVALIVPMRIEMEEDGKRERQALGKR